MARPKGAKDKQKRKYTPRKPPPPPPWPVFEDGTRELNYETASDIRDERAWGKPVKHLAAEFGVTEKVISDVVDRLLYGDAR